jgi:bifunctional DNA-binding transcriptional regulator/antitoxin component of YhaV-PrlF toxin-antitoxin module
VQHTENSNNKNNSIQGIVGQKSFSLVLPKKYAIDLGIGNGDFLTVQQQEGRIIIEKEEWNKSQSAYNEAYTNQVDYSKAVKNLTNLNRIKRSKQQRHIEKMSAEIHSQMQEIPSARSFGRS